MILKNKNLTLRPYRVSDALSLHPLINARSVYENTSRMPHPYPIAKLRRWLRSRKKGSHRFAVVVAGKAVGGIGLEPLASHAAELGYWLGEPYRGKGIMTEAVRLLCAYGFSKLKLSRISANVFVGNTRSSTVLVRNGFRKEGTIRKHIIKNGKPIDAWLYAKVR